MGVYRSNRVFRLTLSAAVATAGLVAMSTVATGIVTAGMPLSHVTVVVNPPAGIPAATNGEPWG